MKKTKTTASHIEINERIAKLLDKTKTKLHPYLKEDIKRYREKYCWHSAYMEKIISNAGAFYTLNEKGAICTPAFNLDQTLHVLREVANFTGILEQFLFHCDDDSGIYTVLSNREVEIALASLLSDMNIYDLLSSKANGEAIFHNILEWAYQISTYWYYVATNSRPSLDDIVQKSSCYNLLSDIFHTSSDLLNK